MKNLFVLALATTALVSACDGDDDDTTGAGGTAANGGSSSAAKGGSSSAGKAGSVSGGKSGAATGGTGGSSKGGAGGSSNGAKGGSSNEGASAGEGGATAGEGGATAGESSEGGAGAGGADNGGSGTRTFHVTLENVGLTKRFTSAGVFNTPVGDSSPGPATPGKKYEFTIDAGRKQKLSFATMLAATNDLFFGPNGSGIALYDESGDPISGDVTSQIHLWDAGTEINEEPHTGPNTVTNQAAPNTGPAENGNVVDIADATDGVHFDYPPVADVISVTVTHLTGTEFKVTIMDVSSSTALQTTGGDFPAPLSPGVWVLSSGADPLFTVGMPDRGQGLERIAEDGNPATLGALVGDNVGLTYPASPGVWVTHGAGSKPLFTDGAADYGDGLEHIAEDGNPATLGANLHSLSSELSGAIFNMPVGSVNPGAILPGSKYEFSFDASPGQSLSFASMLAATNDVFFGTPDSGIPLFDAHQNALSGDITSRISLWDAGTEGNEEPGIGPNTVTNQLAADTGTPGEGKVQLLSAVDDGFTYPAVDSVLKVTVTVE